MMHSIDIDISKYEILEDAFTVPYIEKYKRMENEGNVRKCFIGDTPESRFVSRDSYNKKLTDLSVLMEYCLYPMFVKGDADIPNVCRDIISDFSKSDNVLELFQACNFLYAQKELMDMFKILPFEIETKDIIENITGALEKKENEISSYNNPDVYSGNFYDSICKKIRILSKKD